MITCIMTRICIRCLNEDTDLNDRALLTERIGFIMACLLKERSNLLQMVDKKVSMLRVNEMKHHNIDKLFGSSPVITRIYHNFRCR